MNKSKFKFFGFSTKQAFLKLGLSFLFAFLMSSVSMNAQMSSSFVNESTATQLLNQEISDLVGEQEGIDESSDEYLVLDAEILFYEGVKQNLSTTSSVSLAVVRHYKATLNSQNQFVLDNNETWMGEISQLLATQAK